MAGVTIKGFYEEVTKIGFGFLQIEGKAFLIERTV